MMNVSELIVFAAILGSPFVLVSVWVCSLELDQISRVGLFVSLGTAIFGFFLGYSNGFGYIPGLTGLILGALGACIGYSAGSIGSLFYTAPCSEAGLLRAGKGSLPFALTFVFYTYALVLIWCHETRNDNIDVFVLFKITSILTIPIVIKLLHTQAAKRAAKRVLFWIRSRMANSEPPIQIHPAPPKHTPEEEELWQELSMIAESRIALMPVRNRRRLTLGIAIFVAGAIGGGITFIFLPKAAIFATLVGCGTGYVGTQLAFLCSAASREYVRQISHLDNESEIILRKIAANNETSKAS